MSAVEEAVGARAALRGAGGARFRALGRRMGELGAVQLRAKR